MTTDLDIVDQLHRWADHLEARADATIVDLPTRRPDDHRRRLLVAVLTVAAAALVVALLFAVRGGTDEGPAGETTLPATSLDTGLPPDEVLPLAGTRWSTQRDAPATVVFELQRVGDGRGLLVGAFGPSVTGGPFCGLVDGTVAIDGPRLRFTELRADPGCADTERVLQAFSAITNWRYGQFGDEIHLQDAAGSSVLRLRGCVNLTCGVRPAPTADAARPDGPAVALTGTQWWLDFHDSGLMDAGTQVPVDATIRLGSATVDVWAGVAGGCMTASAGYELDGDTLTIGTFDVEQDHCGPHIRRLLDRLTGTHRFTVSGNVWSVADLTFLARAAAGG